MKGFVLEIEGVTYTARLTRKDLVDLEREGHSLEYAEKHPLEWTSLLLKKSLSHNDQPIDNIEVLLDKIVDKYDFNSLGEALGKIVNEIFMGSETSPKLKVELQ